MGYYKRSAYRNCRNQLPFFDSTLEGQVFPDRNGLCVAGATHCTKMLENYCYSINTRFCAFHRVPANFSKDFWTPTGLFRFKRLAVTSTKKRKICYKPFDFFLSEFESKKLGGAYQRPQGGGRGGGGRWSGWWRKVVGVVEEGGRGGGGRWSNGGRGQKWKGHLCVLRSKTHIIN